MNNQERNTYGSHESFDEKAVTEHAKEHQERLKQDRESAAERSKEIDVVDARREALERASKAEREQKNAELSQEKSPAERRGPRTKHERDASYNATMLEVRSQMSAPSRAFSTFIHNPTVEKVSDVVGGTVARPNAILAGAVTSFILTLVIYLVARYYGYLLSGTETIAAFVLGWILGNVFDYLRLVITGKKQ